MMRRPAETGLTLIEMLVVLAIIGVASGATVLGLGFATRAPGTAAEAERLAAQLRLASDEAMLGDRPLVFAWDGSSYRFDGGGADYAGFRRHTMPIGVKLVMPRAEGRIALDDGASGPPLVAELAGGADRWQVRWDGATVSATQVSAT